MKDENYISLQGWQVKRLRLAGDRLLIYSAIYGFTQDGHTPYRGGYPYLQEWTGKSRDTVRRCLATLVADGLIVREEEEVRGVVYVNYRAVIPPPYTDGLQDAGRGGSVATPPLQNATPPLQNATQEHSRELNREQVKNNHSISENNNSTRNNSTCEERKNRKKERSDAAAALADEGQHGAEFREAWAVLVQQPKWRTKTDAALRMSLKKLARYPEAFAVRLMEDAIENGWQGVVFDNTEEHFKKWQKDNGRNSDNGATDGAVYGPTPQQHFDDTEIF